MQKAKDAFLAGKTRDISFRKKQLKSLKRMYEENESLFLSALAQDLNKVSKLSKYFYY